MNRLYRAAPVFSVVAGLATAGACLGLWWRWEPVGVIGGLLLAVAGLYTDIGEDER